MNIREETNLERNGARGEILVAKILNAIRSTNKFDSKKDMTCADGVIVEVKTQVPWYSQNAFTLDCSKKINFNKCMDVDRLFFVEVPYRNKGPAIRVYECTNRRGGWSCTTGSSRRMYCLPIDEMTLFHTEIDQELADLLRADANSAFSKK
jgi:hypothetical protein